MVKLLCIHGLQYRHNDPQQLLWVLEGLHVEVYSTAFRIQSIQLTPANIACREGWNSVRAIWSLCNDSLSFSLVESISRFTGCWSLAVRLVKDLNAHPMHALEVLLYTSIDLVFRVPEQSS
jgi:hypothetical protein